jgi:hypothetical protein
MRERLAGLRQAVVMLIGAGLVGLAAGGIWSAVQDESFRSRTGIALVVVAGLLSLSGSSMFGRAESIGDRAFLGMGPDLDEADSGPGLTAFGVLLLVSLPLFVVGGLLYGAG